MSDGGEDDERSVDGADPLEDELDGAGEAEVEGTVDDPADGFVEDVTERPDAGDEDPFERIGAGPVPEGDPFERIDQDANAVAGDAPTVGAASDDHGASGPGPNAASADAGGPDTRDTDGDPDDPFDGFDAAEGDPFDAGQSAFERVEVGETEGVWERMDGEDADDAAVREVPGRRYVEVSKHSYCERCEYFSEPPDVGCSHEGTRILEFTDMETVRLVDCPIVAERTALEDES